MKYETEFRNRIEGCTGKGIKSVVTEAQGVNEMWNRIAEAYNETSTNILGTVKNRSAKE